jgi:asparagine synthase (glutamine-hydrolysing)
MQPFVWGNDQWAWMCNGEIYNAEMLEEEIPYLRSSGSDCEVLGAVWDHCDKDPVRFCRALDGVFAIALYDKKLNTFIVARDPYGVRPLFYTELEDEGILFASERKALEPFVKGGLDGGLIYEFPPGEVWRLSASSPRLSTTQRFVYHQVPWVKGAVADPRSRLAAALTKAVQKRLMTERPVAALLSGGLDSSLIAALVQRELKNRDLPPLKTFSIGMAGATDLKYAKMVAEHIGSDHREVVVTADEMFAAIPQVIKDIESYDITTVRASVGNWLVSKAIREFSDCKVVFNGDGSDEVFGSYLYFFRAPSDAAYEGEVDRLLREISKYDVLRSDRCISSHGLEARTPFLDKQFVATARAYPTALLRPGVNGQPEKKLLRDAFAGTGLLPDEVLWRQKEAFSDGVSQVELSWYQIIQKKIEEAGVVPDGWEEIAFERNWWPAPKTKEAFWYRQEFEKWYPHTGNLWPYWMPRWSPETSDPSARTLNKQA